MLAPLAEVYVRRNFLAAASRRLLPWLVVLVGSLVAAPAFADPKTEREAQALQKKAIEEDNLNVNYPAAIKKLQTAIGKCGADKCSPPIRASLLRDLGAMQVLNNNADEARASFAQALALDASLELDPAYKNPQIEQVWNDAKKKGGGAGGGGAPPPEPAGGGGAPPASQPSGDFAHTPPPEELVRTPLPIYAEYSGSETLARVIVKYKGPGMGDWKPLELPKVGSGWGALIPCKDVGVGTIQYYIQGFNAANDPVATSGSRNKPFTVPVKPSIAGAPPGLPGQEAPKQCSETSGAVGECPPDFPGCTNKKPAGEECKKDGECASMSCVEGKCADKKSGGEKCESDDECASGSCSDGTCTATKKAEGDECSSDDECESASCKEGKCGEGGGKFKRFWVGFGLSMDFFLVPGTTDVCALNPATNGTTPATPGNPYSCVDPSSGDNFPKDLPTNMAIAKHGDLVQSGFAPGNLRIFLSFDYALNANILLGVRAGYELFTDPASSPGPVFAPVHAEARFTYLFGNNAITRPVAPMMLLAAGIGEFDTFVQVPVFINQMTGGTKEQNENAWLTAGPGFAAAGGGVRFAMGKRAAATLGMKLEAAFGGSAGLLFGAAPELAFQFGF
jgi:hypothetical protein